MPIFWKIAGTWINVDHIVAVRELLARADGPPRYKVILGERAGEATGEIVCEGEEGQELLHLLEAHRDKRPPGR
jgi:hypothetical protein